MSSKLKNSKLVSMKNPILYNTAEDVVVGSSDSQSVVKELMGMMEENPTIQGISAPQIGHPVRIAACRYKGKLQIIQNPKIEWHFGIWRSLERCLSIPDAYFVHRPLLCRIFWFDVEGKAVSKVMFYKKARIFLHEIDHLNGVCITKGVKYKYTQAALALMEKQKQKKGKVDHGKAACNTTKA